MILWKKKGLADYETGFFLMRESLTILDAVRNLEFSLNDYQLKRDFLMRSFEKF